MRTLNTIQTLAKVGRILCKIVFILTLIGVIGCVAGIVSLQLIPESIRIGEVTVRGLIERTAEISIGTCYAAMATGAVLCAGEAVLSKIAERYFVHELEAGTPFTLDGAKELQRLGICAICIPIGAKVIAEIVFHIMRNVFENVADLRGDEYLSLGLGVMLIVASLLCRYGAEVAQGAAPLPEKTEE